MAARVLPVSFFARSAVDVAPDLLGKLLCRRRGSEVLRRPITEVEAYHGFLDRASHAHRGPTRRNAVMFGPPGHWYVYLCYGVHWMLNVSTDLAGTPSAVLVRGVEGLPTPGVLTRELAIDGRLDGRPARRASGLWIEDAPPVAGSCVRRCARVGVAYAGPTWAAKPWRFLTVSERADRAGRRRTERRPSTAAARGAGRGRRPSRPA